MKDQGLWFNEMLLFYHVVQRKSFSQAAEYLDVSNAYISKHISQLEKHLQTRLIMRSTRQIALTEAGEVFFKSCEAMLRQAEKGYEALANFNQQPSGTLKISLPDAFGRYVVAPVLIEFQRLYPEIKLSVFLESQMVDIYQQSYDLVLRTALWPETNLVSQKIADLSQVLCASPRYFQQYGMPATPEQLQQHRFAIYSQGQFSKEIILLRGRHKSAVMIDAALQSNNLELILQMLLADSCMAIMPKFMVEKAITENKLIVCLADYELPLAAIYALYPEREFKPLKLRLFVELLQQHLKGGY